MASREPMQLRYTYNLQSFQRLRIQVAVHKCERTLTRRRQTSPRMNRRISNFILYPIGNRRSTITLILQTPRSATRKLNTRSFRLQRLPIHNNLQKAFKKQTIASRAVHVLPSLLKKSLLVNSQEFLPRLWRQLTPELYHNNNKKTIDQTINFLSFSISHH